MADNNQIPPKGNSRSYLSEVLHGRKLAGLIAILGLLVAGICSLIQIVQNSVNAQPLTLEDYLATVTPLEEQKIILERERMDLERQQLSLLSTSVAGNSKSQEGELKTQIATVNEKLNAIQKQLDTLVIQITNIPTPVGGVPTTVPSLVVADLIETPTLIATRTPQPTLTATTIPTETPLPIQIACEIPSGFVFESDIASKLGCAKFEYVRNRKAIIQQFERGVMVIFAKRSNEWDERPGALIFALANDGTAWEIQDTFDGLPVVGNPYEWYSCYKEVAGGRRPPETGIPWRGFGRAWCDNDEIEQALGRVKSEEFASDITSEFQVFNASRAFKLSNWYGFAGWNPGQVYIVYNLTDTSITTTRKGRWQ